MKYICFTVLLTVALTLVAADAPLTPPAASQAPASKSAPPPLKGTIQKTTPGATAAAKNDANDIASLRAKAERGNVIAQYNLGLAYADGRETEMDLAEAFVWLSIAAQNGGTGKALDALLTKMSSLQINEGRRRLDALRAGNPLLKAPAPSAAPAADTKAVATTKAPAPAPTPRKPKISTTN